MIIFILVPDYFFLKNGVAGKANESLEITVA